MMIDDEKYLNELREKLFSVTEKHSVIDKKLYANIAHKIRNETGDGIKELIGIIRENDNKIYDGMVGSILALHNAFMLFEANGCPQLAKRMLVVMSMLSTMSESADKYVEVVRRAEKSKARKGKTNRHNAEALGIAKDTWSTYPNASVTGMAEEIYFHLRKSWTNKDLPKISTIERWLTDSGLIPNVEPKNRNRDFKLIIKGV